MLNKIIEVYSPTLWYTDLRNTNKNKFMYNLCSTSTNHKGSTNNKQCSSGYRRLTTLSDGERASFNRFVTRSYDFQTGHRLNRVEMAQLRNQLENHYEKLSVVNKEFKENFQQIVGNLEFEKFERTRQQIEVRAVRTMDNSFYERSLETKAEYLNRLAPGNLKEETLTAYHSATEHLQGESFSTELADILYFYMLNSGPKFELKIACLSNSWLYINACKSHPLYKNSVDLFIQYMQDIELSILDINVILEKVCINHEAYALETLAPYLAVGLGTTVFFSIVLPLHKKGAFKIWATDVLAGYKYNNPCIDDFQPKIPATQTDISGS